MRLEEIRKLDAGSWFNTDFQGERVPTLVETLNHLDGRVSELYIEVKAGLSHSAIDTTLRLCHELHPTSRTTIISFDWWALKYIRERAPNQRIGFLTDTPGEFDGAILRAVTAGNAIVDCNYRILLSHPEKAAFAHDHSIELTVYTVDDVRSAQRLVRNGVHGVTTNQVSRLLKALTT